MPSKRTPLNRTHHARIGPETVRLWRLICEIQDSGADEAWEEDGGRRREMFDAENELFRALGLGPWHYSPSSVSLDEEPAKWQDPERFALAQGLRRLLEAAAANDNDGGVRR